MSDAESGGRVPGGGRSTIGIMGVRRKEARVSNTIVDIPLGQLDEDTDNARTMYVGIPLMADSIAIGGLLENLVVVQKPDLVRKPVSELTARFIVKAGNRRLRAMKLLVTQGRLSNGFPVPCKILESDGVLEAGIENLGREDLRAWEVGKHYLRLAEKGMHQKEIASAHARSQQHVSLCIRIARDLSPKVIERLQRIGLNSPNVIELARLAELRDYDTLGPDTEKQLAALDILLGEKKQRGSKNRSGKQRVNLFMLKRVEFLQANPVPKHAEPYLTAILRFLRGDDDELKFPRKNLKRAS